MKLELDKRIPYQNCIFTCFDTECAEPYIGKQGYFTSCYSNFANINNLLKGTLTKIGDRSVIDKYYTNKGEKYYSFFLPEDLLLSKECPNSIEEEKKFIPFETIDDLRDYKIRIGDPVQIKHRENPDVGYSVIVTNIAFECDSEKIIDITLGTDNYVVNTLCEKYLIKQGNEWVPFGKRVEE